jgi:hypothetical protein
MIAMQTQPINAELIYFNKYTVHYFSQSSAPWEAAYINCFYEEEEKESRHTGYIIFTYPNATLLPGQESETSPLPTKIPAGQHNHLDSNRAPFFVIYYDISRFGDVMNLLQHCVAAAQSMVVSADPVAHVWALCNNERVPVGAR